MHIEVIEFDSVRDWVNELVKFHISLVPLDIPSKKLIGYASGSEEAVFSISLDLLRDVKESEMWYSEVFTYLKADTRKGFLTELNHAYLKYLDQMGSRF
jgi:hypothetical protein